MPGKPRGIKKSLTEKGSRPWHRALGRVVSSAPLLGNPVPGLRPPARVGTPAIKFGRRPSAYDFRHTLIFLYLPGTLALLLLPFPSASRQPLHSRQRWRPFNRHRIGGHVSAESQLFRQRYGKRRRGRPVRFSPRHGTHRSSFRSATLQLPSASTSCHWMLTERDRSRKWSQAPGNIEDLGTLLTCHFITIFTCR